MCVLVGLLALLCYAMLCCAVLCCAVLCCAVSRCTSSEHLPSLLQIGQIFIVSMSNMRVIENSTSVNLPYCCETAVPSRICLYSLQPKSQQPSRPDLMSLAAQRINQPMSPSLLGRAPLLSGAALSQTQYAPYTHTVPPSYRPDYSSQLPFDYTQSQQSGFDGYGMHANYLAPQM